MRVAVSGASGFVGRRLIESLTADSSVIALGRKETDLGPRVEFSFWDPMKGPPEESVASRSDAVVHLAGEPVAQRWDNEARQRIRDSRVIGTRHLVEAIGKAARKPAVLVCASAVGIYGDRGSEWLDENSQAADGFLADVCRQWEAEADKVNAQGVRVVKIRIGLVLGQGGGALAKMLPPFRLGLGATLGDGKQWMSWIHLDDLAAMMRFAMEHQPAAGVWNGVSPHPVTNADFTEELGRAVNRPAWFRAPQFLIELGAGEMAQVMFASQRCRPTRALEAGFDFRYPEIGPALEDVVK